MRADVAHYILVASLLTSGKFRFEIEDLEKKKNVLESYEFLSQIASYFFEYFLQKNKNASFPLHL